MKYYHTDIESGVTYEVTKEQYEAIQRLWECAKPKLEERVGKIVVFGTGGTDTNSDKLFEKLWKNKKI